MDLYTKVEEQEFRDLIREGGSFEIPSLSEAKESRTLTTTSDGSLVPRDALAELSVMLYDKLSDFSAAEALGITVIDTKSGQPFPVITTNNQGGAAGAAEASEVSETANPSFTRVFLDAFKRIAVVQVSNELVSDSYLDDLLEELSTLMAQAVARIVDPEFLVGSGNNRPSGLVNGISSFAGGSSITLAKLFELSTSLDASYYRGDAKQNLRWGMAASTWQAIANIGSTGEDRTKALSDDKPLVLYGYPVVLSSHIPTSGRPVIFGHFGRAYVARRVGTLDWSNSSDFANDLTVGRVTQRVDGKVRDAEAARAYVVS